MSVYRALRASLCPFRERGTAVSAPEYVRCRVHKVPHDFSYSFVRSKVKHYITFHLKVANNQTGALLGQCEGPFGSGSPAVSESCTQAAWLLSVPGSPQAPQHPCRLCQDVSTPLRGAFSIFL